jgi:hypothetical protein
VIPNLEVDIAFKDEIRTWLADQRILKDLSFIDVHDKNEFV